MKFPFSWGAICFFASLVFQSSQISSASLPSRCHRSLLTQAFSRGLDSLSPPLGYHGTNIIALRNLLETGILPSGVGQGNEGWVYFYPDVRNKTRLQKVGIDVFNPDIWHSPVVTTVEQWKQAVRGAEDYSFLQSRSIVFARFLGVQWPSMEMTGALDIVINESQGYRSLRQALASNAKNLRKIDYLFRLGFTQTQIGDALMKVRRAIREKGAAEDSKIGVVISFKPSVIKNFQIEYAGCNRAGVRDEGLRILAPEGIPAKYIAGIEPLDEMTWDYLESVLEQK